ncbi:class I adenylate-forming enzyme family protein [Burkholderia singularis]|uniref:Long-chain-fatty-acid--CoA ligase n=1 Tax=Burkholderia singularis TaxID=1503053 RepID=A0A238H4W9_9BURK|nr:Long-chain-fatty-acid--CoA ligase [Burkholderia singularis]
MKLHLTQALHRALQQHSDDEATCFAARRQTYRQLYERVAHLAGVLYALGVRSGERVGLLALNSDCYFELLLAIWWAGGVVNPVNTRWSVAEIVDSLDDCDTRVLFIDDAFTPSCATIRGTSSALCTLVHFGEQSVPEGALRLDDLLLDARPMADALRNGGDLAGVFYTGGTTGRPKGVMLSHEALVTNSLISLLAVPFTGGESLLHSAPLFHLAGLSFALRGLMNACRQVFLPTFTPDGVLQAVKTQRVSHLMLVPTMLQMLVDHPGIHAADLASVRWVGYGASPISEALLDRAFALLPEAEFVQGYGMTELSAGVSYLTSTYHTPEGRKLGKLTTAGRALAGVDVRIVDAHGRDVPRGQVGEVVVRSPCVMQGYWNQAGLTTEVLRAGWLHTGDAARMDEQGFITIVDRLKDMIVSGGENVYCAEVENALAGHCAVAAVAVIGVPSVEWGEAVHAVVVRNKDAWVEAAELQAHCRSVIAGYKCPRSIEFVDALPVSGAGKVMKHTLREPYWRDHDRRVV